MRPSSVTLTSKLRTSRLALLAVAATLVIAGTYFYFRTPPLNVILITLDTVRADRLGAYGYQPGSTPAFDDLARRGVMFEQAYSPMPFTLPSHTTMLTGLYPPEHGLRGNGAGRLGSEIPILAELLKKHQYNTGAFIASFVLNSRFGLERGFDLYDDVFSLTRTAGQQAPVRRDGQHVVDSALAWLRSRTAKPFFCWIHLYDAHSPYDLRRDLFGTQFEQQPYDAGVAVEDQQVARVVAFLKEKKLDDRTLIVVVGDHGEGLDEHSESQHGSLVYNTTLQVPLVIAGPRSCRPGHRVTEPISLVDLLPTLLDQLRIPSPPHLSGRSLSPALAGGTISPRPCYAESEQPFLENNWCPLHAVISGRWKFIHTTLPELYDLESDRHEMTNLAESEVERSREMRNMLEVMQEHFVPARADNLNLSQQELATLSSLGYVTGKTFGTKPETAEAEVLPDIKQMLPYVTKLEQAQRFYESRKFNDAFVLAHEIVTATNQFPAAELLLGDTLMELGRLDESADAYRSVIKTKPHYLFAHAHLGDVYFKQGNFEEAASEYREVLKLEPDGAHFYFGLAQTLKRLGKIDEAIAAFREAIRSDPGFVIAHFQLGLLLTNLQRPLEAVKCFELAVKNDPRFAMGYTYLANTLLQLGDLKRANESAQKAVELQPQLFEARLTLGLTLASQQRYAEGVEQLRIAQKLRPDDPRPTERIRQIEASLRKSPQVK